MVDKGRERKEDSIIDGEKIEEVECVVYLGSLINLKGSSAQDIRRRLAMGRGAVQNMASISKSRGTMLGLKVRFLAVHIAIYGCESWAIVTPQDVIRTQDVIIAARCNTIYARCNKYAKCNNFYARCNKTYQREM